MRCARPKLAASMSIVIPRTAPLGASHVALTQPSGSLESHSRMVVASPCVAADAIATGKGGGRSSSTLSL